MDIHEAILAAHKPELEKEPGHVYQIWEDGEITLQKSGPLLWNRTLHMLCPGKEGVNIPMPCKMEEHSYANVESEEVAIKLRAQMGELDYMDKIYAETRTK